MEKCREFPDYIDFADDIAVIGSGSVGLYHPPTCDSAMNRLLIVLAFVFLAGCRMCGSSYDHYIPAHTDRVDDYRGGNVFYRAGSIFWNDGLCNESDGTDVDLVADRSMNAGNFGTTTPIELKRPTLRTLEPKKLDRSPIGIPPGPATPTPNGDLPEGFHLFEQQIPNAPNPSGLPPSPVPSDVAPMPFDQTRNQSDPIITIEELRRLDPTVTDIRILNVEDVLNPKVGTQTP